MVDAKYICTISVSKRKFGKVELLYPGISTNSFLVGRNDHKYAATDWKVRETTMTFFTARGYAVTSYTILCYMMLLLPSFSSSGECVEYVWCLYTNLLFICLMFYFFSKLGIFLKKYFYTFIYYL